MHGKKLHNTVGKTAKLIARASRWMPGYVRRKSLELANKGVKPMG